MLVDTSQVSKLRLSTLTRRYIDIPCASVVLFKSAFKSYVGWLTVGQEDFDIRDKGSFHLRFSGIRPLRGRGGVPPFSAKEKILLFFTLIFR